MGQIVPRQVSKTYPGGVRGAGALNLGLGCGGAPGAGPGAAGRGGGRRRGAGAALALDGRALAQGGGKSRWTARAPARSRVRPGEPVELAVDPASPYFLDPESGRAIGAE